MKILYISDVDQLEPIFFSQVLPHVNELKKRYNVSLFVLSRTRKQYSNEIFYNYRSVPGDFFYLIAKYNFILQRDEVKELLKENKYDLIYSRGSRGGLVGIFIKQYLYKNNIPLFNDVRADVLDEHKENYIYKNIFHYNNKVIYKKSDVIFSVSSYLKMKLCKLYNFNTEKAHVFPTFVPDNKFDFNIKSRSKIRYELNYSESDVVLIYSGNLAKWQNLDTILTAFSKVNNPWLKILVLTKDERIYRMINELGIDSKRIHIKSVNYDNIQEYYHAADYGLLIRDNTDTNKSAAPTKFSEYVNSGLALIINDIESDYVKIFKSKELVGVLLQDKSELAYCFDNLTPLMRKRNSKKINILSEIVKEQSEILDAWM